MNTEIYVVTQFEALHHWPAAPEIVKFLRDLHRHLFHVKIGFSVNHADRDLEYFTMLHTVKKLIQESLIPKLSVTRSMSCEMMAEHLIKLLQTMELPVTFAEVSEDGENGAIVRV
jgi:hypothetical protein